MRQKRARARRIRRIVALTLLAAAVLATLLLTAFGTGQQQRVSAPLGPPAAAVAPGPPRPEVVAMRGSLPLQLPVQQERLTAIGYHASGDNALALQPLGRKANEGFLSRVFHRIFGGGGGNVRYYQLPGGSGPSTTSLDVGAPAGTDVYAPVDGTIVGLDPYILNGRRYGAEIDIQPAQAPSLVVAVTRLRPDPSLAVGSTVSSASSKLGVLLDLSHVEEQVLGHYTHEAGNHVSIEIQPSTALALP
jgi:hypothetical protein